LGGWVFCRDGWAGQRRYRQEVHSVATREAIARLCHGAQTPGFSPGFFDFTLKRRKQTPNPPPPPESPTQLTLHTSVIVLRSTPATLSEQDVRAMLKETGFFDFRRPSWRVSGLPSDYWHDPQGIVRVVYDRSTRLMWQKSGSEEGLSMETAKKYISKLNRYKFAGFTTWRLPTLEELMSLMKSRRQGQGLYISRIFDSKQDTIWTGDYSSQGGWYAHFQQGVCDPLEFRFAAYVRAVRTGKPRIEKHSERMLEYFINATRAAIIFKDENALIAAEAAFSACSKSDRIRCIDYLMQMGGT